MRLNFRGALEDIQDACIAQNAVDPIFESITVVPCGMGSIVGSIGIAILLGIVEGVSKLVYPEAASTIVSIVMPVVLIVCPAGLSGKEA